MKNEIQSPQSLTLIGASIIRYSYNQILVFDSLESTPGCQWSDAHWQQGFARRNSIVSFATLDQAGTAALSIVEDAGQEEGVVRAIQTSLDVPSGKVCIEGVDEYPISRYVKLIPGVYRVTASQRRDSSRLAIFLSFSHSSQFVPSLIIKADSLLNPRGELLETSDIP